jgi:protein involved in polysaccharide export with SLBB domain
MHMHRKPKLRFSLRDLLVIFLGIAIGYSLNPLHSFLSGRPTPPSPLLPTYVIEPPDVLMIQSTAAVADKFPALAGQHRVGPDGNVNLGSIGSVYVAGLTLRQAQTSIEKALAPHVRSPQVSVDVYAYNSKTYYIITKGGGNGDNVAEFPITGSETVLDAIANLGGVARSKPARIFIARPAPNGVGGEQILSVDWNKISLGDSTSTNYQLLPRDRLFIDTRPAKSPAN